jgi:hypothetical protein
MKLQDCTFVVRQVCADCSAKLCDTKILTAEEIYKKWWKIVMTAGFAAGKCPNGCKPTFSDLNIHTDLIIIDFATQNKLEFQTLKFLYGNFYQDDHAKVCECNDRLEDEIYFSDKYPAVHGKCGKWIEEYKR